MKYANTCLVATMALLLAGPLPSYAANCPAGSKAKDCPATVAQKSEYKKTEKKKPESIGKKTYSNGADTLGDVSAHEHRAVLKDHSKPIAPSAVSPAPKPAKIKSGIPAQSTPAKAKPKLSGAASATSGIPAQTAAPKAKSDKYFSLVHPPMEPLPSDLPPRVMQDRTAHVGGPDRQGNVNQGAAWWKNPATSATGSLIGTGSQQIPAGTGTGEPGPSGGLTQGQTNYPVPTPEKMKTPPLANKTEGKTPDPGKKKYPVPTPTEQKVPSLAQTSPTPEKIKTPPLAEKKPDQTASSDKKKYLVPTPTEQKVPQLAQRVPTPEKMKTPSLAEKKPDQTADTDKKKYLVPTPTEQKVPTIVQPVPPQVPPDPYKVPTPMKVAEPYLVPPKVPPQAPPDPYKVPAPMKVAEPNLVPPKNSPGTQAGTQPKAPSSGSAQPLPSTTGTPSAKAALPSSQGGRESLAQAGLQAPQVSQLDGIPNTLDEQHRGRLVEVYDSVEAGIYRYEETRQMKDNSFLLIVVGFKEP